MCDGFGIAPYTFLLAYVCSPIYYLSTAVRVLSGSLVEEPALRHVYSLSGYIHPVDRNVIPCSYPNIHKDFSTGSMMCLLPIHKGYYGESAHHTGVSNPFDSVLETNTPPAFMPGRSGPKSSLCSPRRAACPPFQSDHSITWAAAIVNINEYI